MRAYGTTYYSKEELNHEKGRVRDLISSYIVGFQNDKYWRTESEGYKALQELLELIADRHGDYMQEYKE